ncbi:nucleosome assembly protein (nap) protein [Plakobranchus ocellatus]|uniref:Nucleosome assembly protein (Nap) protein n=1 Tax=Plakobranchus ocellatus TaxID=259542 RepID=A0AAV3XZZ8_9GAST|nr:nucleosome assembly protein (nap) protein [Plakobranchus ocellatus]
MLSRHGLVQNVTQLLEVGERSFLRLEIYFDSLILDKIVGQPAFTWNKLLSDIGGQLGLLLGFSILTAVEILELLVMDLGLGIGLSSEGPTEAEATTATSSEGPTEAEVTSAISSEGPTESKATSAISSEGPTESKTTTATSSEGPTEAEATIATSSEGPTKAEATTATSSEGPTEPEATTAISNEGPTEDEATTATSSEGPTEPEATTATSSEGPTEAEATTATSSEGPTEAEVTSATSSEGPTKAEATSAISIVQLREMASWRESATSAGRQKEDNSALKEAVRSSSSRKEMCLARMVVVIATNFIVCFTPTLVLLLANAAFEELHFFGPYGRNTL